MQKNKILLLLVLLLFSFALSAQKKSNIMRASVLWEIKDPKTNNISYLMGSIHTLRADSFVYRYKKVLDIFSNSRLLACESFTEDSVESKKYIAAIGKLQKKTFKQWFGKNQMLVDRFFTKQFKRKESLSSIFNSPNITLYDQVGYIQLLDMMLYDSILVMSGLHKRFNFDYDIIRNLNSVGMPILTLDDPSLVSKNTLTKSTYANQIVEGIKIYTKIINNDTLNLINNYFYRVVPSMKLYYSDGKFDYNLREKMANAAEERHRIWINKLIPELKKGNTFILVGVGHLFGRGESLIPELKKIGFIVTPVNLIPSSNN